jgi:hypothetical protein
MELLQILIALISFSLIGGGFFYTTKNRLDKIEDSLTGHNKLNTEILDRLARIETKLDFYTKII